MSIDPAVKSRVDGYIRKAGQQNLSRLTASQISEVTSVNLEDARERLFQLGKDGQIVINYEIECPDSECARSFKSFDKLSELRLGEKMRCEYCETEFLLEPGNIWVTFTPNPAYFVSAAPAEKKTS